MMDILDTAGEVRASCSTTTFLSLCDSNALDTQEEYNAMSSQYYRAGEGFLLMYAITADSSLEEMQQYALDVLRARYIRQRRRGRGAAAWRMAMAVWERGSGLMLCQTRGIAESYSHCGGGEQSRLGGAARSGVRAREVLCR